jgi:hypothetical protein
MQIVNENARQVLLFFPVDLSGFSCFLIVMQLAKAFITEGENVCDDMQTECHLTLPSAISDLNKKGHFPHAFSGAMASISKCVIL